MIYSRAILKSLLIVNITTSGLYVDLNCLMNQDKAKLKIGEDW